MDTHTRILGIDYGSKRIGIALTNAAGDFALPHSVVSNAMNALQEIVAICGKNNVGTIVMGDSKDFSGKDNSIMKDVRRFADEISAKLPDIKIILHPEFLTSAQAERLQGKNAMLDASAATLILQSYIDTQRNTQKNTYGK